MKNDFTYFMDGAAYSGLGSDWLVGIWLDGAPYKYIDNLLRCKVTWIGL